jgi:hypothetical protein
MLRKLAVIAAVTASFGLGSVGTAAAADTPDPWPILDHSGCYTTPLQCMVEGFLSNLMTGSADSGSAS